MLGQELFHPETTGAARLPVCFDNRRFRGCLRHDMLHNAQDTASTRVMKWPLQADTVLQVDRIQLWCPLTLSGGTDFGWVLCQVKGFGFPLVSSRTRCPRLRSPPMFMMGPPTREMMV